MNRPLRATKCMPGIRERDFLVVRSIVMRRSDWARFGGCRIRRRQLLRLIVVHFSGVRGLQHFRTAIPATDRTVYCSELRSGGRGRQVLAKRPLARFMSAVSVITARHSRFGLARRVVCRLHSAGARRAILPRRRTAAPLTVSLVPARESIPKSASRFRRLFSGSVRIPTPRRSAIPLTPALPRPPCPARRSARISGSSIPDSTWEWSPWSIPRAGARSNRGRIRPCAGLGRPDRVSREASALRGRSAGPAHGGDGAGRFPAWWNCSESNA